MVTQRLPLRCPAPLYPSRLSPVPILLHLSLFPPPRFFYLTLLPLPFFKNLLSFFLFHRKAMSIRLPKAVLRAIVLREKRGIMKSS